MDKLTAQFSYIDETNQMIIWWEDGDGLSRSWYEVPRNVFDELNNSSDKMKFFENRIRNHYPLIYLD